MSSTGAGKIPRHISPSGPIEMGQNDTERGHPHGCQRDKEAPPERHPSDPRGETASAATGGLPGSLRGRGTDFGPLAQLSSTVGELVRADTDFQAVFAQMGESFSKGEPAVETFRSLWDGVFPTEETDGVSEQAESQDPGAEAAPTEPTEGGEDRGAEAS